MGGCIGETKPVLIGEKILEFGIDEDGFTDADFSSMEDSFRRHPAWAGWSKNPRLPQWVFDKYVCDEDIRALIDSRVGKGERVALCGEDGREPFRKRIAWLKDHVIKKWDRWDADERTRRNNYFDRMVDLGTIYPRGEGTVVTDPELFSALIFLMHSGDDFAMHLAAAEYGNMAAGPFRNLDLENVFEGFKAARFVMDEGSASEEGTKHSGFFAYHNLISRLLTILDNDGWKREDIRIRKELTALREMMADWLSGRQTRLYAAASYSNMMSAFDFDHEVVSGEFEAMTKLLDKTIHGSGQSEAVLKALWGMGRRLGVLDDSQISKARNVLRKFVSQGSDNQQMAAITTYLAWSDFDDKNEVFRGSGILLGRMSSGSDEVKKVAVNAYRDLAEYGFEKRDSGQCRALEPIMADESSPTHNSVENIYSDILECNAK